jgi:hypothetical protein
MEVIMKFEDHCRQTEEILGEDFAYIHKYMDKYARTVQGIKHRQFLHTNEGVEEVRKIYGDIGALVAMLHIYQDFRYAGMPDYLFKVPNQTNWNIYN